MKFRKYISQAVHDFPLRETPPPPMMTMSDPADHNEAPTQVPGTRAVTGSKLRPDTSSTSIRYIPIIISAASWRNTFCHRQSSPCFRFWQSRCRITADAIANNVKYVYTTATLNMSCDLHPSIDECAMPSIRKLPTNDSTMMWQVSESASSLSIFFGGVINPFLWGLRARALNVSYQGRNTEIPTTKKTSAKETDPRRNARSSRW